MLIEPFDSTLVGDFILARRVFRSCLISFLNRVTLVDLVELDMVDFDFILGMDGCMLVLLPLIVEQG